MKHILSLEGKGIFTTKAPEEKGIYNKQYKFFFIKKYFFIEKRRNISFCPHSGAIIGK